jgi:hypothetical protein
MSTAELLVATAVIAVISPLAIGLLMAVTAQTRSTLASSVNVADARLALASVERQVRSGSQPLTVSTSALSFATCADQTVPADVGRVRVVEFRIAAGALQTRSYRASGSAGGWRTLINGLGGGSAFAASGANGVRVTLAVQGAGGRQAFGDTVISPRNQALATPLPEMCP